MILPQNTKYIFIDMNSYFASCEQQANVSYRHKPVAVAPINIPNGCIISASYEAKAYGVKTGHLIKDARKLCPQLIICESNVKLYLDFHKKLIEVLSSFSPFVTVKSIDEAVIKLSPNERNSELAQKIARNIKEKIYLELGKYMKSSIGIGPNVWISKMAAESEKPDGLVELKLQNLFDFYETLKLTDLKGIAGRMEIRLNSLGIFKPLDIYLANNQILREKLGIAGDYWHFRMHGYDLDIAETALPKNIGQSHVLEPKYRNWPLAWSVCQKLAERATKRLRSDGLTASGVYLYIRYLGMSSFHKGMKTDSFSDSQTFLKIIKLLWNKAPKTHLPLKIGINLFYLSQPNGYQQKIFPAMQKLDQLYESIDLINDKYGSFTIKPANILNVGSSAPVRISFGQPSEEI